MLQRHGFELARHLGNRHRLGAIAARKFPIAAGRLTMDGTELFVSRGVGTVLIPVRINCPPEVAILTLRARTSSQ